MPDETQIIRRGHGTPVLIVEDIATEAFTLRKVLERAGSQRLNQSHWRPASNTLAPIGGEGRVRGRLADGEQRLVT